MPQAIREPFLSPYIFGGVQQQGHMMMIVKMVFPVMHGREKRKKTAAGGQQSWPLVNYVIKSRGSQKN